MRWVLGEQSARQLRGSKMENVIFNGTQAHKPLGFASVNLTINNERGKFPLDFSEILITRRVYRSGVSEYFINKAPCRLKDIRDLFADTGTGSHSYSVIEQEMIDWVLNDIHGERRLMFEEAAGIVKYRMRREEAQRKLDLTKTDLVRLEDILEELRKTVGSLKYQMAKARRYEIVRDRIRRWELVCLRRQLGELLAERRATDGSLAGLVELAKNEDTSLAALERRVEVARAGGEVELAAVEEQVAVRLDEAGHDEAAARRRQAGRPVARQDLGDAIVVDDDRHRLRVVARAVEPASGDDRLHGSWYRSTTAISASLSRSSTIRLNSLSTKLLSGSRR